MVIASELSKGYAQTLVLKSAAFTLEKGSVTALAGPNGAGKTTLIKILAQIIRPDTGRVLYNGKDARDCKAQIGYVPQQNAFFYELSVRDNLQYWLGRDASPTAVIDRLELGPVLGKKASQISGGMQRRLNMAIALMNSPEFLFMDEPLTGVDIATRQLVLHWIRELGLGGMTILYATHHTDEIVNTADSLMLMQEGNIIFTGKVPGEDMDGFISSFLQKVQ